MSSLLLVGSITDFRKYDCLIMLQKVLLMHNYQITFQIFWYFYFQTNCYTIDGVDEAYEFENLKNAIKNIGIHSGIQQR